MSIIERTPMITCEMLRKTPSATHVLELVSGSKQSRRPGHPRIDRLRHPVYGAI